MPDPTDRVAALHRVLVESEDDDRRADVHVELGRLALERRRVDLAIRHFREALLLRPNLDAALASLRRLGALPADPPAPRPSLLDRARRLVGWRSVG